MTRALLLVAAVGLLALPASAAHRRARHGAKKADARTLGLGHSCHTDAGCRRGQKCLSSVDSQGKPEPGFCVLPCAAIDSGLMHLKPNTPLTPEEAAKMKSPPPRCPAKFQCRSAGGGVPIDLCIKE